MDARNWRESVLTVEVFGRSPNHDPKQDSIVRTEASRLRARLSEYHLGEGNSNPVIIELPKGRYIPVLRQSLAKQAPIDLSAGTKHPLRRAWLVCARACVHLATATTVFWPLQHRNAPISIGVLPL